MSRDAIKDWAVQRVRPPSDMRHVERYDEEKDEFILDDGKPGLAFSGYTSFPIAIYVRVPYTDNVLNEWREGRETHFFTRDGALHLGASYDNRDKHPNEIAGTRAMNRTANRYHCANGKPIAMAIRHPEGRCVFCEQGAHGTAEARRELQALTIQLHIYHKDKIVLERTIADQEKMIAELKELHGI